MPYKLFNGNANIVSDLITKRRKEKNMSYSDLSNKLQLLVFLCIKMIYF